MGPSPGGTGKWVFPAKFGSDSHPTQDGFHVHHRLKGLTIDDRQVSVSPAVRGASSAREREEGMPFVPAQSKIRGDKAAGAVGLAWLDCCLALPCCFAWF